MALSPTPRESRLAEARANKLIAEFSRKRNFSIACAFVFGIAAIGIYVSGQPMLSFCSALMSLISVVRSIDAHGQLDEIGRRPAKFLYTRLSMLQDESATTSLERSGKE